MEAWDAPASSRPVHPLYLYSSSKRAQLVCDGPDLFSKEGKRLRGTTREICFSFFPQIPLKHTGAGNLQSSWQRRPAKRLPPSPQNNWFGVCLLQVEFRSTMCASSRFNLHASSWSTRQICVSCWSRQLRSIHVANVKHARAGAFKVSVSACTLL
jgi:hypothetical protein